MLSKADKTKQLIIEKSAPLFNKKGYAGTSMNDIMAATGLTKGGLYGNFDSKDEIAALAFEYSYNKLRTELVFKIKQQETSLEKLYAILHFYRNYTVNPSVEGGCPLQNTAIDADDAYPFLKKKAKQALYEMLGGLEQIIENGIRYKELKATVNAKREAEIIYAQIEGAIMMAKVSDDVKLLNRILDNLRVYIDTHLKQ
ncbi:MAG TPA: TetR/AcrR family transcriptional regulator [Chitinophagaceae bacterium]|nr:TetR/AcrR family transcriptional regulator [Chitinophagaceae bacterium]